ncbi:hypothetical protein AC1031_017637 [Aphanomyces cochlioides]|nr:hypothetical protein AC1031_017637 [Aphanomyces cochlioides]
MSLSQADFRRLLETPRVVPQSGDGGAKNRSQLNFGGKRPGAPKSSKDREKYYKKFKKTSEEESDPPKKPRATLMDPTYQGKYRDRAAERRAGVNVDDQDAMEIEATINPVGDGKVSSLAKGLNMDLLSKLKQEKEKLKAQHDLMMASRTGSETKDVEPTPAKTSALGLGVLRILKKLTTDANAKHVSDLFLPGRLHYEFEINCFDVDTLPRFVQISKDDCPEPERAGVSGYIPTELLLDVQDCFKPKELRRRKKETPPPSSQEEKSLTTIEEEEDDDSDGDIFADAGEYVPPGEEDEVATPAVAKGDIFKNLSAAQVERDTKEREKRVHEEKMLEAALSKAKAMYEKSEAVAAEREKAERLRKKVLGDTDEYGECFPDYEEVEEEGDDGKKTKDGDGKEKPKKRKDKKTEQILAKEKAKNKS